MFHLQEWIDTCKNKTGCITLISLVKTNIIVSFRLSKEWDLLCGNLTRGNLGLIFQISVEYIANTAVFDRLQLILARKI
jgi:hypothetical protein